MTSRLIILSTADFDNEVWTNKQYIAAGLADRLPVVYIESLGLRAPNINPRDLMRVWRRLTRKRAAAPTKGRIPASADLQVVSPRILPFHGNRVARRINRYLMARLAARLSIERTDVLWTFSPVTYGLEDRAGRTIYHSVDLLHDIPGVPARALLAAERHLVRLADFCIASSTGVADHLQRLGAAPALWENVADTTLFAAAVSGAPRVDRAIFAGHVTPTKIDFRCLQSLLEHGVEVAIAGQVAADGSRLSPAEAALLAHPRITHLGVLPPQELAAQVARSKVGIIPYLVNGHTDGIFPMKVYEYLSAGLSVVATDLRSLRGSEIHGLVRCETADFAEQVAIALAEFTEQQAADRSRSASRYSWESRIEQSWLLLAKGAPDE